MTKPKSKTKNGVSKTASRKVQQEIPGTQRTDYVESIDEAIADLMQDRRTITKLRAAAKEQTKAIIALMRELKRTRYIYEDGGTRFEFTVPSETKLHQKRVTEPKTKKAKRGAPATEVTAPEAS